VFHKFLFCLDKDKYMYLDFEMYFFKIFWLIIRKIDLSKHDLVIKSNFNWYNRRVWRWLLCEHHCESGCCFVFKLVYGNYKYDWGDIDNIASFEPSHKLPQPQVLRFPQGKLQITGSPMYSHYEWVDQSDSLHHKSSAREAAHLSTHYFGLGWLNHTYTMRSMLNSLG
jgi:hypothetical protein